MIIDNFWMFALAGLLLNLTPGNDMLYVMARSSGSGIKAGIISAFGIGTGCLVHVVAAMAGLSALLAQSALAFDIIKYLGAGYLVYLGIRSLVQKKNSMQVKGVRDELSFGKIFRQGALTNVLNPKVALFFLAFLPQFINPDKGNASLQILFMGSWFDLVGTLVNIIVAVVFGKLGAWLSSSPGFIRWQDRVTGIMLITLGFKIALESKK